MSAQQTVRVDVLRYLRRYGVAYFSDLVPLAEAQANDQDEANDLTARALLDLEQSGDVIAENGAYRASR